jgi:NADH:ubiquinone oxidoreductase subunit 5 (subunit L)/multisubunit Na+/H+ antiporter MnhA subunit
METVFLLVCVLVPLIGAFILPSLGKLSAKIRNSTALAFVLTSFVCAAYLLPSALSGNPVFLHIELPLGLSFGLLADNLAVFMALTASFVASVIVIYSFGYMHSYNNQNEYYMMVVLFIGAMMGLVFSVNLIFIYIFWEISAVCCWRLIGFYRDKDSITSANKAFFITVGGAFLMLVGFIGIYAQTGTFDLTAIKGSALPNWVTLLILFGILSKSATIPLHSWLPDAGVAPSPVTSLLHAAVLVKIGVFVYARLFVQFTAPDPIWETVVPVIAAVSSLISSGAALVENNIKRIIAYSTISQLAFILLGLSVGNYIGFAGGLLYLLMHSISKAGLFLCAGIVEHSTHTKDIRKLGGLAKTFPKTALAFTFCAFSVMGIPPFGGFFAKHMVIDGAMLTGKPWLAAVFILGAVMTVLYLARVLVKVFFGKSTHPGLREGTKTMVGAALALAIISLFAGIFIKFPSSFAYAVVDTIRRW